MDETTIQAVRREWEDKKRREEQAMCPDAEVLSDVITKVIYPLAQKWTDVAQLDEAIKALEELYAEMEPRISQPHFPSIWSTHVCVQPLYQKVHAKLRMLRRLQIRLDIE
jgi:hypothetical protein